MYVPALNAGVAAKICEGRFGNLSSLCFCLEDAITAGCEREAETQLAASLSFIAEKAAGAKPLLFVRVRDCNQLRRLPGLLGETLGILTGIILPKFDLSNAADYCSQTISINSALKKPLLVMPIIESRSAIDMSTRYRTLLGIKELLDGCSGDILNIRVGAMDFCSHLGLRRTINQTIYDIGAVASVLSDIITVFGSDYVVSAPVWEYFKGSDDSNSWETGLKNELRLDLANGFIGKTIIHPSQVEAVLRGLQPSRADVEDASAILSWQNGSLGVAKSWGGNRMNEAATHKKWARKVLCLAEIYGVGDSI